MFTPYININLFIQTPWYINTRVRSENQPYCCSLDHIIILYTIPCIATFTLTPKNHLLNLPTTLL
jgi:hypothetical protein